MTIPLNRPWLLCPLVTLCSLSLPRPAGAAVPPSGEVTLDLERWNALRKEIDDLTVATVPPQGAAIRSRSMQVRFDRGLLRGRLVMEIETFSHASQRVPVIGSDASLERVLVDNERAVAIQEGDMYSVLVEGAKVHPIDVTFAVGREESRFSRSFSLGLPSAPASRLELDLSERDLEVEVEGGVILEQHNTDRGTRLVAALDDGRALRVNWKHKATHEVDRHREMEVNSYTLLSIGEETIRSQTELDWKLISGETDRLEAVVPPALEISNVTGGSVLQWYSDLEKDGRKRLVVLLRHLIDERVSILVHGQMPKANDGPTPVVFLEPHQASLRNGFVVIEGHPSFDVTTQTMEGAAQVGMREVPETLMALSNRPLLFAYRFEGSWPTFAIAIQRNAEITLTQAVIDDLQASTITNELGVEITKMRLNVRNNTRQYLVMGLPKGASVTHALIDGMPFHPAVSSEGNDAERLLIPLRQSEKINAQSRFHTVRRGETLGEISLRYFHRSDRWQDILQWNEMSSEFELHAGQNLKIPEASGNIAFEESSFVVELAYKVPRDGLGAFGRRRIELPKLDVPVMSVTWHVYLPGNLEPLAFDSNLTQLDAVRYGPLRRLGHFLDAVLSVRNAWAGGSEWQGKKSEFGRESYENILKARKSIFKQEKKREVAEVLSAFPLVGERFRFSRVLLGERTAFIKVAYVRDWVLPIIHWATFLLVAAFTWLATRRFAREGARLLREPRMILPSVGFSLALLVVAHFVLGTHHQMLLGAIVGLWVSMASSVWRFLRGRAEARVEDHPFELPRVWHIRTLLRLLVFALTLGFVALFPLLFGVVLLLVSAFVFVRIEKVHHV